MPLDEAQNRDIRYVAIIAAAAVVVFANALWGDFVYDDIRQIVQNPLIQRSELYGKALVSDVWAFKGDGSQAASNYWRPVFTAWSIVNFKLFGASPFGWHLTNLLLHIGASLLAYLVLIRWAIPRAAAFWISLIFAVHPVHVESVSWISGSPDLLMAVFLLGSFLLLETARVDAERTAYLPLLGSVALFLLALGSKEVAVAALPVYAAIIFLKKNGESDKIKLSAGRPPVIAMAMFALSAAAYLAGRMAVVGTFAKQVEDSAPLSAVFLTLPRAVMFYIGHAAMPIWLSPNYSIRPIETFELTAFAVPLLVVAAIFVGFWAAIKANRPGLLGIVLFGSLLAPALVISAFPREQIVHDRYLYLPLLGLLVALWAVLSKLIGEKSPTFRKPAIALLIVYVGFLSIQTFLYNRAWSNDLSLWKRAVEVDPNSASNWLQLGATLGGGAPATSVLEAFDRSIAIKRTPLALMGRARILIAAGRVDEAIRDLREVTSMPSAELNAYTLFQSYEALGLALQTAGRIQEAEKELRNARDRLPIYRASLTEKIAVLLYLQGKKEAALKELESVRTAAASELIPAATLVYFRLGMLYVELGRGQEANAAFRQYLERTETLKDAETIAYRKIAADHLRGRALPQR